MVCGEASVVFVVSFSEWSPPPLLDRPLKNAGTIVALYDFQFHG